MRVAWIDRARGLALCAMIVFHFSYDLSFLGYVTWPVSGGTGWRVFAISIAASFVALAGVSLQIAHGDGIRWRGFWRREAVLAIAALAVTLGTGWAMGAPVWFGILHAIALFSLMALPFVAAPTWIVLGAAAVTFAAPLILVSEMFSHPALYPLGLAPEVRPSLDYEPIFPWFAAMLAGLALARHVPLPRQAPAGDILARMGRHSLAIYLLHQPILFGGLMAYGWLRAV
ncbi:heparan-alpha-glucosaminide N-acetyltransferase [Palleronia sp. LCG004]|uniref:heparan-alpha-glucosaminide N-acetyltransferase n=1 Tax=Palleronia sp. LCG004 TaxID=3079304 RepID=UPI0029427DA4|nr:heparan-alpha-glucosaminide N-acetyltransferase [Palleronia sp. LCG004]WOI56932.1 heparan-alpha-glucosaminide N-acetyltransferase [Palleronia sp. LCG004]